MKHAHLLALLVFCVCGAIAQQKSAEEIEREKKYQEKSAKANADTSKNYGWKHTASAALNLTEVSFKDWVAGGSNTLAYAAVIQGSSALTSERTIWTNDYRLGFGQARLADQGLRKTDDEIYLESLLIYKVGAYVNPYAALTLRTQFGPGYNYDTKPETEVSKFFDPAYFTQSAGVAYKPVPEFTTRIGAALREAVTSQYNQYATDLVNHTVHKVWTRGGMESVSELNANVAENIQFVARLELFAPFQSFDRITVLNDYSIVAKVNKYISTGLSLNIINDVNVSARTQLKQGLALGLSYTLF
jgi:hypothetical protein